MIWEVILSFFGFFFLPWIRLDNTQTLISSTKVTILNRNRGVFSLSTTWLPKSIHRASKVTEHRDVCGGLWGQDPCQSHGNPLRHKSARSPTQHCWENNSISLAVWQPVSMVVSSTSRPSVLISPQQACPEWFAIPWQLGDYLVLSKTKEKENRNRCKVSPVPGSCILTHPSSRWVCLTWKTETPAYR